MCEGGPLILYSLILVFFFGIAARKGFEKMKLPGLVGLVLLGILLGPSVLNQLESGFLALASDIRLLALITILLRAGLGLNRPILRQVGKTALKNSFAPCLAEGLTIMVLSRYLLGFDWIQGGIIGFMLGAVSPAVVVPAMLEIREKGLGQQKNIPMLVLTSASLEAVIAVTVFSVFVGLAQSPTAVNLAWLPVALVPLRILGGIVLGIAAGLVVHFIFQTLNLQPTEQLLITIGTAMVVTLLGNALSLAGLLAVLGLGFILQERGSRYFSSLSENLTFFWIVMQLFLFILIGAAVDLQVVFASGGAGLALIVAGLTVRATASWLATAGSYLNRRERWFCAIACLPKATVQAAVGAIPLSLGISGGEVMLAVAVLAILVTAPLGAIAIQYTAPRLLDSHDADRKS